MSAAEEKIIDLVDVIADPETPIAAEREDVGDRTGGLPSFAEVQRQEWEQWVREELDRLIRKVVEENVQSRIREIMVEEVKKAIDREVARLKRT